MARLGPLLSKSHWAVSIRYYRLAVRSVTGATNERTLVTCASMPGVAFNHSVLVEKRPGRRAIHALLAFLAWSNSFTADWMLRLRVSTNMSKFLLSPVPYVTLGERPYAFCVHSAARLAAIRADYGGLWRDQFGTEWREPGKAPFTWPVLAGDDERWEVRVGIDAVVADAYGLTRDQYEHVLSTFSHKSYPKAPNLCLAKFDELKKTGLEAFTKKHDPYWDIPLNTDLPQPDPAVSAAIDKALREAEPQPDGPTDLFGKPTKPKRGRKKR